MVELTLATGATTLTPLILFVAGMAIYTIFIFKFYKFIARRDIFEFDLQQYHTHAKWEWLKKVAYFVLYLLEYVILFPILVSLWFIVFAVLLMLLSKNHDIEIILLIAMAIVSTVRVTAYYDEDLSKDVAKMLPFGLLAVLLVDISFFSIAGLQSGILEMVGLVDIIIYYLIFAIFIEFVLRILTLIFIQDEEEILEPES